MTLAGTGLRLVVHGQAASEDAQLFAAVQRRKIDHVAVRIGWPMRLFEAADGA